MQERLRAILDKIVQWWKKFNNKQRMLMISSVGVVIIALVILGVVMSKPKMVELVASDDAKQASEIKSIMALILVSIGIYITEKQKEEKVEETK